VLLSFRFPAQSTFVIDLERDFGVAPFAGKSGAHWYFHRRSILGYRRLSSVEYVNVNPKTRRKRIDGIGWKYLFDHISVWTWWLWSSDGWQSCCTTIRSRLSRLRREWRQHFRRVWKLDLGSLVLIDVLADVDIPRHAHKGNKKPVWYYHLHTATYLITSPQLPATCMLCVACVWTAQLHQCQCDKVCDSVWLRDPGTLDMKSPQIDLWMKLAPKNSVKTHSKSHTRQNEMQGALSSLCSGRRQLLSVVPSII
jgi:hypothetical protein